ncbi:C40 family peptidase [Maribacter aurantiacus]|uniref:NlpC/P60 family protein n=1 Tax=Maribacter aurantiacus TaxID=1882343 RepID=A0A5R8M4E5_9FLAO|nr:NlpC/P60 family protein [Maribacter aurantiacus]TLF44477.1 NlpC/P60 family protein [Maribacter aurantiacus]
MQYGICPLSVIPLRISPEEASEMTSQVLFGEHFKILESRKYWSKIRVSSDKCEGWVPNNQVHFITKEEFILIEEKQPIFATDLLSFAGHPNGTPISIILGSSIHLTDILNVTVEGNKTEGKQTKEHIINTAINYLNAPELKGGKTPFGIDASGFAQMVYKINGYNLLRTAQEQARQGEALSFIEECEPGDLAFFDDSYGHINHVGIVMKNNFIIHVNGMVRIDRIDHTGIFNYDLRNYSHQLRVLKRIL